jgi:uncharacterized membrane protein
MLQPFSPLFLLLFLGLLLWLVIGVNLGLLALTFEKLGLDPGSASMLLLASLLGSAINLPLFTLQGEALPANIVPRYLGLLRRPPIVFDGRIRIVVNVGGCLVPVFFSIFLLRHSHIPLLTVALGTAIVAAISYYLSRPIPGIGIGMPMLAAPFAAALVAILLGGEYRAPLAYISGSLGVLIGAELLHLKDIRGMSAPVASIGGAGTFDGIFVTGFVAVLLS